MRKVPRRYFWLKGGKSTWGALIEGRVDTYKHGLHSCGGWGMLGGMSTLARKLVSARDHVGATGHREWVVQESARRSPGTEADWDHRLGCLDCGFEVWVSMAEIAEEGRLELLDSYGLGAEMEAIKRTPLVERRLAWDLLLDDSR